MTKDKDATASVGPGGNAWLTDLAEQLDTAIHADPQRRSAGKLIVRALIMQALKGDMAAIREVMTLAHRRQPGSESKPVSGPRGGRPSTKIDLEAVKYCARIGMKDLSKIARVLGVPKQTMLGGKHGHAVREAFETGRALFERDTLEEYAADIAANRRNPLLVFKVRQIGWQERVQLIPPGAANDSAVATMSDEELSKFLEQAMRTLERERQEKSQPDAASPDLKTRPQLPAPVEPDTAAPVKTEPLRMGGTS